MDESEGDDERPQWVQRLKVGTPNDCPVGISKGEFNFGTVGDAGHAPRGLDDGQPLGGCLSADAGGILDERSGAALFGPGLRDTPQVLQVRPLQGQPLRDDPGASGAAVARCPQDRTARRSDSYTAHAGDAPALATTGLVGTFNQTRSAGARSHARYVSGIRQGPDDSSRETRRLGERAVAIGGALSGALLDSVEWVGTGYAAHGATFTELPLDPGAWVPPGSVATRRTTAPGHVLGRRCKQSKVADAHQTATLPLQRVDVGTLGLDKIRARMHMATRTRFDEVWALVGRSPGGPVHPPREDLRDAGIVEQADDAATRAWFRPFTVVEEKDTGCRRRFIAWTESKNDSDPYEPVVPLTHVSTHLTAVFSQEAALTDLKASSFQVLIPPEWRTLFRCRTECGRLVQLTRLPMGYKASPALLHTLSRVLGGDPEVVLPQWAAPDGVRPTV